MHPLNAVLLGLVVAWATKRRNGVDGLGSWRWIAALAGSLFAYSEVGFRLLGEGAFYQAQHGVMWSAVLLPFFAFIVSGFVGALSGLGWGTVFLPVTATLISTWWLGLLTEEGIFPLAMLVNVRVGLGLMNRVDLILAGLCALGLVMSLVFRAFDRDMARISLVCVVIYVMTSVYWAWQAEAFGKSYAETLGLRDVKVQAIPQPLSPLNWRVIVEEGNGRLHDTMINLWRTREAAAREGMSAAALADTLYKPKAKAVWRVYRRYGGQSLGATTQRRVRSAWFAWKDSAYGWYGRYAVFDRLYEVPAALGGMNLGCVGFRDIRFADSPDASKGAFVVCPARGGGARVFRPVFGPKGLSGVRELIPLLGTH